MYEIKIKSIQWACQKRTPQKVGDILQLGNVILPEPTIVHQQREDVIVLPTGVGLVEFRKVPEDNAPGLDLLLGIIHMGQGLAMLVVIGNVGKVLATLAVFRIGKARMIGIQFRAVAQNLVGKTIQVAYTPWEPGHSRGIILVVPRNDVEIAALLLHIIDSSSQSSRLSISLHEKLVAGDTKRGSRFNVHQVDIMLLENGQNVGQSSAGQRGILGREQ